MRVTAQSLNVEINGLALDNGLVVDTVQVYGTGVNYDVENARLSLPTAGSLRAHISAASVEKFVTGYPPGDIRDMEVLLGEGRIIVRCKVQSIVSVSVQATGELVAVGPKVEFRPTEVRAAGFGLPTGLVEGALNQVNPLVDLSLLPFPVTITGIQIEPSGITVDATAGPT